MRASDEAPSMSLRVYGLLKRDIIRCVYAPGDTLHEGVLAAKYEVSKTPVREALNTLRREGYVVPQPRRGYLVAPISLQDVQDIYELRLMVEPQAARLAAARIRGPELERLRELADTPIPADTEEGYSRFLEAGSRFHAAVAAASGNAKLAETVEHLLEMMERFFHMGQDARDTDDGVVHDHGELVRALAEGDADRAETILRDELVSSRARVVDTLLGAGPASGLRSISVR